MNISTDHIEAAIASANEALADGHEVRLLLGTGGITVEGTNAERVRGLAKPPTTCRYLVEWVNMSPNGADNLTAMVRKVRRELAV